LRFFYIKINGEEIYRKERMENVKREVIEKKKEEKRQQRTKRDERRLE